MPLLLITTTGRVTGTQRTTPVVYQRHGDDLILVASNVGTCIQYGWRPRNEERLVARREGTSLLAA